MDDKSIFSMDFLRQKTRRLSLPTYLTLEKEIELNNEDYPFSFTCLTSNFKTKFHEIKHKNSYKKANINSLSEIVSSPLSKKENEEHKAFYTPSLSHFKKSNFPSLCGDSLKEIMQKMNERYINKDLFGHPIQNFGLSQVKLINTIQSKEKKNTHVPIISEVSNKLTGNSLLFFEKSLSHHFLFKNFTINSKEKLIESLKCYEVSSDSMILKEQTFADMIYFIESGIVGIFKNDHHLRTLKPGNLLGEQQIFSVAPLKCSYVTLEKCLLWGIRSKVLASIMLEMNKKKYEENRKFIIPIKYFQILDNDQIDEICFNLNVVQFSKGTIVAKEGETYVNFYIIKEGIILATESERFSHYLKKGDFFGHGFFYRKGEPFTLLVDSAYVECLCINNDTFKNILGGDYENIVSYNLVGMALRQSEIFSKLNFQELERIIAERNFVCYKENQNIPLGENIYILIEGKVVSKKGRIFLSGELIGEESFFSNKKNNTVNTLQECLLSFISKSQVEKILNMSIQDIIKISKEERNIDLFKEFSEEKKKIKASKKITDLTKIRILKILGEGHSGIVLLVQHEKEEYALKIISKGWVVENHYENYIRNEKTIQDILEFPFFTKLITTEKDDLCIYLFMEYVKGIDLFEILVENQSLDEESTKFYIGLLLIAIEYLHRKGIIHRDLKPENIIVDETGYIKICDLGFAKLMISKAQRTYTIVGTPHYMAPEMILGKGYSFPVDHYSIGVIAYVCFYGKYPFGDGLDDTYQIYEAIVTQKLKFPKKKPINEHLKVMLKNILLKEPEARLGKNCESCRYNKWYEGYPWSQLLEKKLKPPYQPNIVDKYNSDFQHVSLFDLMQQNDIKNYKDMTEQMKSQFSSWSDIF